MVQTRPISGVAFSCLVLGHAANTGPKVCVLHEFGKFHPCLDLVRLGIVGEFTFWRLKRFGFKPCKNCVPFSVPVLAARRWCWPSTSRMPKRRFPQAVAAGAAIRQPLADMFWGDRHGQPEDPFGHRWTSLSTCATCHTMRSSSPHGLSPGAVPLSRPLAGCCG
jgi:hypothetical protein